MTAEEFVDWCHQTMGIWNYDCLGEKHLFLGNDPRIGFLYTDSKVIFDNFKPMDFHDWRSTRRLPEECCVLPNEELIKCAYRLIKDGKSLTDKAAIKAALSGFLN